MVYHYINLALLWIMRLALLVSGPYLLWQGDTLGLLALLAFIVTFIPTFLKAKYEINLPWWLEFLIVFALFLDVIVGSEFKVYTTLVGFDWFTHVLGTVIVSLIAFSIVYSLKVTKVIHVSTGMIWFFTVVFALSVGAFYEILEFLADIIFSVNSQVNLTNTMIDLIFDLFGGILTATVGTYYLQRYQGKKVKDVLEPYIKLSRLMGMKARAHRRKFNQRKFKPRYHG